MPSNILIVEDEWLIAEDFASTLRNAGHRIIGPCNSVTTAISTIDQNSIDAALLDMELRGEKSFSIAEYLKQRNIPFAFLSGHCLRELPDDLREEKVLSKPIESTALLAAVESMCSPK